MAERTAAHGADGFIDVIDAVDSHGAAVMEPDLVGWILGPGRRLARGAEFFDALCWRLVGAGLPLWRAALGLGTLHPQIRGLGYRWWRERRRTQVLRVAYGVEKTTDFTASPMRRRSPLIPASPGSTGSAAPPGGRRSGSASASISARSFSAMSGLPTGWISPRSARRSTSPAGSKV